MKKILVVSVMLLMLFCAGLFSTSQTQAAATATATDCPGWQNPPTVPTCGYWVFLYCETDSKGQVWEVYGSSDCQATIHRPIN